MFVRERLRTSSSMLTSKDPPSPASGFIFPLAIAARFKSSGLILGSAIVMLRLESTMTNRVWRIFLSKCNVRTGCKRIPKRRARKAKRKKTSIPFRVAVCSSGIQRYEIMTTASKTTASNRINSTPTPPAAPKSNPVTVLPGSTVLPVSFNIQSFIILIG